MPPLAFCGECGHKLLEGKPFCGECGHNNAGGVVTPAKAGVGGGGGGANNVSGKVCGGCKRSLEGVLRYTSALDKEWHLECFVCAKCRSDFNGGKFFVQDGAPICENCTRNTGPRCAGCNQPCGEKYIGALDKMWHSACFVCSGCSKPLSGGIGFISRNERPYCDSSCANRTTNQARPAVQTSAVSPSRPTAQEASCLACSRNGGKAFCPECGKKLGGTIVVNREQQQREQQQREQQQREQQQREQRQREQQQQQREQQQREQQQREQQQREQQQREQQQREQRQREEQQREQRQRDQREQQQRDREQQQKREQQQSKSQAVPTKSFFCGECGTKLAGPGFCTECGHNNGAPVSVRPTAVKSQAPSVAPSAPDAPEAPSLVAPEAPPMAPSGPPMAPSAPSNYGSPGGKGSTRGDLLAQINAGKKLKKAPKVAERGADGLPIAEGGHSGGSSAGGSKKTGAVAAGGRGGPMDMQAQLAAKLAARNK